MKPEHLEIGATLFGSILNVLVYLFENVYFPTCTLIQQHVAVHHIVNIVIVMALRLRLIVIALTIYNVYIIPEYVNSTI